MVLKSVSRPVVGLSNFEFAKFILSWSYRSWAYRSSIIEDPSWKFLGGETLFSKNSFGPFRFVPSFFTICIFEVLEHVFNDIIQTYFIIFHFSEIHGLSNLSLSLHPSGPTITKISRLRTAHRSLKQHLKDYLKLHLRNRWRKLVLYWTSLTEHRTFRKFWNF